MDPDRFREQTERLNAQIKLLVRTEKQLFESQHELEAQVARVTRLSRFVIDATAALGTEELLRRALMHLIASVPADVAVAVLGDEGQARASRITAVRGEPPTPGVELEADRILADVARASEDGRRVPRLVADGAREAIAASLQRVLADAAEVAVGDPDAELSQLLVVPLAHPGGDLRGVLVAAKLAATVSVHEAPLRARDMALVGLFQRHMEQALDAIEHREELETQVAVRTAALRGANLQLRRELAARERIEAELIAARDAAEAAARVKSQFLTNMSHEIRTPMSGVIGMAELLASEPLSETQRSYIEAIRSSGAALMALVGDILDFSKIEAGFAQLEGCDFSLRRVVREVMESVLPTGGDVAVTSSLAADVPDALRGDPARLGQVLRNLLSNALKFTERGTIALRIRLADGDDRADGGDRADGDDRCDGVRLRFEVQDTGIGIPADGVDALFEPFYQADSSTTRRHGGTGLGLAICKQLVEHMRGAIGATPNPGGGATFWFTTSLGRALTRPADRRSDSATALRPLELASPVRALVVEDNDVNRQVAVEVLRRFGCEVDVATDGLEAVAQLEAAAEGADRAPDERGYDIIFMDCQMPRMDGYEATGRIRRLAAGAGVPIVGMTAHALAGDRERCLAAGMDDYVTKPATPAKLRAILIRWLDIASRSETRRC